MKKVVVFFVLLLAAVGAIALFLRSSRSFGVDEDHPMGTLELVEKRMVSAGLEKDESVLNDLRKLIGAGKVTFYVDPPTRDKGPVDKVTVIADKGGTVSKFRAEFGYLPPGKVAVLTRFYWRSVGAGTPRYRETDKDGKCATFSNTLIRGSDTRAKGRATVEIVLK